MIDFKRLNQLYRFGKELTLNDVQVLLKSAKSSSIKKGGVLIEEGSTDDRLYYIRKGLMRAYHINDKGDEITYSLLPELHVVANEDYVLNRTPSRFYYEALEDSSFFSIKQGVIQGIIANNREMEDKRLVMLHKQLYAAKERIDSFVLLSPLERYQEFVRKYPSLNNRVPDKYIANVLGITPVSLSRIRKRIASAT